MAATRKLQGEIDRCLKKVAEGVEQFEDIWKKVHNATNSNQKVLEKYEADLKKEIKKLQRQRDQIKSWLTSAEVKDKSALQENRRLIETQMERFKIVERETKTKAYSKEGLGAAQKMDPAQRIKDEARNWLTNSISALQIQIDQYESEIESLLAGKKKRLDRDKQERMDELRTKLDRHKFHVTKLETLLRLLDNDGVEAEQVNRIKDDVEYYIDSSQDPDFEENEFIYDDIIGLDEVELSDSNNSNETSGSPGSITSRGSPVQSPQPQQQSLSSSISLTSSTCGTQQQQQLTNLSNNYSNDSIGSLNTTTNALTTGALEAAAAAEKRNKIENTALKIKQPVKPTAIRASNIIKPSTGTLTMNDATGNKIISSTPSKNQHHQQSQQTTAAVVAAAAVALGNSLNNSNITSGITPINTSITVGHNISGQQQQQQQQPQALAPNISTSATSISASNSTTVTTSNNHNNNIQGQSVIQTTPSIAFAAVAKNNTSHLENGPVHANTSFPMSAPTIASIVGSNTTQQLTNLQSNSSHLTTGFQPTASNNNTVDAISLKTIAKEAISRTSLEAALIAQGQQQQQQQQQQTQVLQQQQTQALQQHFNADSTANSQQQQTNAGQQVNVTGGVGASTAGVAAANLNGPANVGPGAIGITNTTAGQTGGTANVTNALGGNSNNNKQHQQPQQQQQQPTNEAHIPPLLGVAPLGPSPLHKDHQLQFQMMEAAFYHPPAPSDSEKLTTYFHRTPVATPSHYPQSQLPIYDTVEFYQRLSTETLFFVFYYMEGSKAQYLAAKALKKQSWRFHTKYMMWFQRHEEPKIINDDYEQGTYIYFDYEKWSQRKKEGFTFEYKYLEDKELN